MASPSRGRNLELDLNDGPCIEATPRTATKREDVGDDVVAGDGYDRPEEVTFAFYKPRPMITDLTKGGMGNVALAMSAAVAAQQVDHAGSIALPKPVGQLDKNTTGLMIFTTSGRLAMHLNNHVSKSYRVQYRGCTGAKISDKGELFEEECEALKKGILLQKEQVYARFDSVDLRGGVELPPFVTKTGETIRKFVYTADVSIKCGVFHVVKRLFDSVGKAVYSLERIRIGSLRLEELDLRKPGDFCQLSEIQQELLWGECECRQ